MEFDGSNDQLIVGDFAEFDFAQNASFTVETWMRTASVCVQDEVFVGKGGRPSEGTWWLGCLSSNHAGFFLEDAEGVLLKLEGTRTLNDGRWHHLAATRDGSSGKTLLFVDGVKEAEAQQTFQSGFGSQASLTIGSLEDQHFFDGRLDEVAVYYAALDENTVRGHYFLARAYCEVCASAVRIMPLGASYTQGYASTNLNGYRRPLAFELTQNHYFFNLVGAFQNGDLDFDRDHEGHPGWQAKGGKGGGIAPNIYQWLLVNPAEVILLHIGTNDISENSQSASEVEEILTEIDRFDPDITVVLALIMNRAVYSPETTQFNLDVKAMAERRIANGDKIILVDMEHALIYPDDMADNTHPNDGGYAKTARVWYNALASFMPVCP